MDLNVNFQYKGKEIIYMNTKFIINKKFIYLCYVNNIYKMQQQKNLIYLLLLFVICGCSGNKQQADLIIYNAKVYTVDENFTIAESFVVINGKFIAVGSNEDIKNRYQSKEVLNLEGKVVYPGFIDAHCHFNGYSNGLYRSVNLSGTESFIQIIKIIQKHAESHPSEWIIGRGWDQNDWEEKEFPNNKILDSLFPNNLVMLTRIDGHAILVNSKALKQGGITKDTKIEGGEVVIKDGFLTGILIDNAADAIKSIVPALKTSLKAKAFIEAQKKCFAVGLTSVVDAGLKIKTINLLDSLQKTGDLQMRIFAMLTVSDKDYEQYMQRGKYKTDYLNVRSVKCYADGALGSRGALLIEPYSDMPSANGLLVNKPDFFKKVCEKALKCGYQVCTHAIGDSAVRMMLNIYSEFLMVENDLRWRIEHSQIVHPDDLVLFNKCSIIPSIQTTHATSDMIWAMDRIGTERIKGAYAYQQLLKQNGWIINGTDFPVEDINPLLSFYAAVARKNIEGYPNNGFQMENALTRDQALKAMTIWAAKGSFEENEKGSIEADKFADFVVLQDDIMMIDIEKIPKTKVIMTYIAGKQVY